MLLRLLLLVLCAIPASAEPPRQTAMHWDGDTLVIRLRLRFRGPGLPQGKRAERLIGWWCRGSQRIWNRAQPAKIAGRQKPVRLRLEIDGRVRRDGEIPRDCHVIDVVDLRTELRAQRAGNKSRLMDGYRSWAYIGGRRGKISACFANAIWPAVAAHELGHLLALRDEYEEGRRDLKYLLRGLPKKRPSLMDVSWAPWARVEARHVKEIVEQASKRGWWVK